MKITRHIAVLLLALMMFCQIVLGESAADGEDQTESSEPEGQPGEMPAGESDTSESGDMLSNAEEEVPGETTDSTPDVAQSSDPSESALQDQPVQEEVSGEPGTAGEEESSTVNDDAA